VKVCQGMGSWGTGIFKRPVGGSGGDLHVERRWVVGLRDDRPFVCFVGGRLQKSPGVCFTFEAWDF